MAMGLGLVALAAPAVGERPEIDYMLHCQGCHLDDGRGAPRGVPDLAGLGRFLRVAEGRAYLVQVPGSAFAPLDDRALAALLNWMIDRFDPETRDRGFAVYSGEEVGRYRRTPLIEVDAVRARLLEAIAAATP